LGRSRLSLVRKEISLSGQPFFSGQTFIWAGRKAVFPVRFTFFGARFPFFSP
jgi:hypothetical protein